MLKPYLVEVAPILHDLGATLNISGEFDLDSYTVGLDSYVLKEPPRFKVTVGNAGTGVYVSGAVQAETVATCSRCANEFPLAMQGEVEAFFVHEGDAEGIPDEQEYEFIDSEERIDIAPALLAAIVFETPFVPLHDEECKGLCSGCGADLNVEECTCKKGIDPLNPFAALAELKLEDDE